MTDGIAAHRRVVALFFVSGGLGLGYQVLWSKLVLHFVGVSSWSYAVVLAAFMGGLALGSRVLGPVADRVASSLKMFAYLELGVGLYAVAYAPLSSAAGDLYLRLASADPERLGGMHGLGVKAALAGALLLPPTFLMGGTYPAMVRHAATRLGLVGRRASQLYGVNALGAATGALVTAFVVLPACGVRGSLMLLALGNAAVGLTALRLARHAPPSPYTSAAPQGEPPAVAREAGQESPRPLLALMFFVGLLAFIYEIAWTRYFTLVIGSSTYSFTIIVATFIAGIAIAGLVLARAEGRVRSPLATFGVTQSLAAIVVLACLPAYPFLPWLFGLVAARLPPTPLGYVAFETIKSALCAAVMLVPATLLAASIPLAVMALARRAGDVAALGRDTGLAYAWNTAGNVLGALVAGVVLLPALGVERLLRATGIATALAGLSALALAGELRSRATRRLALPALGAALGLGLLLPSWNPAWFTLSPFRRARALSFETARAVVASKTVILFEDDPSANVLVIDETGDHGTSRALLVNGKPDASSLGDMSTQLLLAHLPCLVHGAPERVLVVGLASGVTTGAVLRHDVGKVEVVDIVRSMPDASRLFDAWSGAPLDDPRTRFVADDARSYLQATTARYDVVISEPSNPWIAGIGSLFSREHYERAASRLAPGGVYCQWVQAYELSNATLAAIIGTFRATFPHVVVFEVQSGDLVVLGGLDPLDASEAHFARGLSPRVREQLATVGVAEPRQLVLLQCFTQPTCDFVAAMAPVLNTDDNLLLEREAPRDLFARATPDLMDRLDERRRAAPRLEWSRSVAAGADPVEELRMLRAGTIQDGALYSMALIAQARVRPGGARALPPDVLPEHETPETFDPPGDDTPANALAEAARRGDWAFVDEILSLEKIALAHEALASAEAAERWQSTLRDLAEGAPPAARASLGLVRADVLAAARRQEEALTGLVALADSGPPDELLLRACSLDVEGACETMASALGERASSDHVRRFVELRRMETSRR